MAFSCGDGYAHRWACHLMMMMMRPEMPIINQSELVGDVAVPVSVRQAVLF